MLETSNLFPWKSKFLSPTIKQQTVGNRVIDLPTVFLNY